MGNDYIAQADSTRVAKPYVPPRTDRTQNLNTNGNANKSKEPTEDRGVFAGLLPINYQRSVQPASTQHERRIPPAKTQLQ